MNFCELLDHHIWFAWGCLFLGIFFTYRVTLAAIRFATRSKFR